MKQRRRARPQARRAPWIGVGIVALAIVGGLFALTQRPPAPEIAGVTACRATPPFALDPSLGLTGVILSTSDTQFKGLVLQDSTAKRFQHPSWDDAGFLGPFITDQQGTIYVAPVPLFSLADNPPAQQNTLWRVDAQTAEMAAYLEVPAAAAPSERNPFGLMGLALDCETQSLYVSSVAGSGLGSEVGRISQIDLASGAVVDQYQGVDAIGIVVLHTPQGKQLLYGSAREPQIFALTIDGRGRLAGPAQLVADLRDLGAGDTEKARRLSLSGDTLQIVALPFTFTLVARSERIEYQYTLRYTATGWAPGEAAPPSYP